MIDEERRHELALKDFEEEWERDPDSCVAATEMYDDLRASTFYDKEAAALGVSAEELERRMEGRRHG